MTFFGLMKTFYKCVDYRRCPRSPASGTVVRSRSLAEIALLHYKGNNNNSCTTYQIPTRDLRTRCGRWRGHKKKYLSHIFFLR